MNGQKSAEGIVAAAHGGEGPNMEGRKNALYLVGRRRRRQVVERPKDSRRVAGGTRERKGWERQASAVGTEEPRPKAEGLLEEVLRRENLMEALKRVRSNRGAPGVDGMTVEALTPYLKEHWPRIREELFGDTYAPQPIRRVEIPPTGR